MPIALGTILLDDAHTTVKERIEEMGGRDERIITVSGLIAGETTRSGLDARIDAILAAASTADDSAELSLREGRRLLVRRSAFSREIGLGALVASFVLELCARDPLESSTQETSIVWPIAVSGATRAIPTTGNAPALPIIAMTAVGDVVCPSFSDGLRAFTYNGTVPGGVTLVLDAAAGTARLDGEDVLPYTAGRFPVIAPPATTLTYADTPASSHAAAVTVTFRDRWW